MKTGTHVMSPEARAKIAAAKKAWWAANRGWKPGKATKNGKAGETPSTSKVKRKYSKRTAVARVEEEQTNEPRFVKQYCHDCGSEHFYTEAQLRRMLTDVMSH